MMGRFTPREAEQALGSPNRRWLAGQMGISESYLSKLMSGHRPWTIELEDKFCAALGISRWAISFAADVQASCGEPTRMAALE